MKEQIDYLIEDDQYKREHGENDFGLKAYFETQKEINKHKEVFGLSGLEELQAKNSI